MAVVAMWKCDRDGTMFENKKDADAYDKELELGSAFTRILEQIIPEIEESKAEEFGLVLARNKDKVMLACKGKPEALEEILNPDNVMQFETAITE
ncbi:MAG: YebG family protein [Sedimenticola sp.]